MIVVKEDVPYTEAEVNILYSAGGAVTAAPTLQKQAEDIANEKNPATGDVYSESEIRAKLEELLASGRKETLVEKEVKPENIASVLGLEHEPNNPFDADVMANITMLEAAKKNYRKLCIAMTEAMVYTRPDLVRALQIQLPAYEEIHEKIKGGEDTARIWENRQSFAETAANMFLFLNDVIFQGGKEYKYKDKGNKYDIITPEIMAEDIKLMDSAILRVTCFLADAPEENAAKADLKKFLEAAMREYDEGVENETLTSDELQDLITAANDCVEELTDDRNAAEREYKMNPGKKDTLVPVVALADEMIRVLQGWNRNFRKISKRLD